MARRGRKRLFLLFLLFPLAVSLPAQTDSTDDSDTFSFSLRPTLQIQQVSLTFNFLFWMDWDKDFPWFDLWNYQVPEYDESVYDSRTDWYKGIARTYLDLIYEIRIGSRSDPFYFRFGKLENITLGDGALLSAFSDESVSFNASRPGLNVKIGPVGHFGVEIVADDVISPSLLGARFVLTPFSSFEHAHWRFSGIEVGASFLMDPRDPDKMIGEETTTDDAGNTVSDIWVDRSFRPLFNGAIDASVPLLDWDMLQMRFFSDFLIQGYPDDAARNQSARIGLSADFGPGLAFSALMSATFPLSETWYADYITSGYSDSDAPDWDDRWSAEDIWNDWEAHKDSSRENTYLMKLGQTYPVEPGEAHLDMTLAASNDVEGVYSSLRFRAKTDGQEMSDQRVDLHFRIEKMLFKFISLDLNYEKNYPSDSNEKENFFSGLGTMKNVFVTIGAEIKYNGIKFTLDGKWRFDETGTSIDPSFTYSTTIVYF